MPMRVYTPSFLLHSGKNITRVSIQARQYQLISSVKAKKSPNSLVYSPCFLLYSKYPVPVCFGLYIEQPRFCVRTKTLAMTQAEGKNGAYTLRAADETRRQARSKGVKRDRVKMKKPANYRTCFSPRVGEKGEVVATVIIK